METVSIPLWLPLLFVPAVIVALVLHEAGHLIAAKIFGVMPLEFGIGMPPRAWSFRTGRRIIRLNHEAAQQSLRLGPGEIAALRVTEQPQGLIADWIGRSHEHPPNHRPGSILTGRIRALTPGAVSITAMQWTIGLLPIGAFVSVAESGGSDNSFAIENRPAWQRATILSAGVAVNLILPVFALAAASITAASITQHQVIRIEPDSPASQTRMAEGATITHINRQKPWSKNAADMISESSRRAPTEIIWKLNGENQTSTLPTLRHYQDHGIRTKASTDWTAVARAVTNAPASAVRNTTWMYALIAKEINAWIRGHSPPAFVGPVSAARETGQVIQRGRVTGWLVGVAIISANIGFVNLLPIMPLDGGRLALLAVEKARRRRIKPQTERAMSYVGMAAIVGLTMTLIAKDVLKLLAP